jgi:hypothetical protein
MISSSATLKKVLADLSDDLALKKVILTDWDGDENEKPEGHPQFIPWTSIRMRMDRGIRTGYRRRQSRLHPLYIRIDGRPQGGGHLALEFPHVRQYGR